MVTSGPTLAELGEFALITEIAAAAARSGDPGVRLGPGDDAAALELPAPQLVSLDTMVEGVHFKTSWSAAGDVGRRAVAGNVADIEAMGGRARHLLVGFSAPADTPLEWVRGFTAGLVAEAAAAEVGLVGGDVTAAPVIMITVTVLGDLPAGGTVVTRSGARPGDEVGVCGRLGWAAAGWAALRRGFRSPGQVVRAYRVPEVPYGQGRVAAAAGATAMIDVSDGLLADLGHLARASGVVIDLESAAFTPADPVIVVAQATGTDALGLVLTGGEDHALAATFPAGTMPAGWQRVGRVLPPAAPDATADATADPSDGTGRQTAVDQLVLVDGAPYADGSGWRHFG